MRVLLAVLVVTFAAAGWVKRPNNLPRYVDPAPCVTAIRDDVFVFVKALAHVLNTLTDQWTTLVTMPTQRNNIACSTLSNNDIFVAEGFPYSTNLERYRQSTGQWATMAPSPYDRKQPSGCGDGATRMWVLGGDHPTLSVHMKLGEYNAFIDAWTLRRDLPVSRLALGMEYSLDHILVFSGVVAVTQTASNQAYSYHAPTDLWTSVTKAPVDHMKMYDGVVAAAGQCFLVGGGAGPVPTSWLTVVHRYDTVADDWTTLTPFPIKRYAAGLAITQLGSIVSAAHYVNPGPPADTIAVYTYDTGIVAASALGDPLLTSFTGLSRHVDMRPGVFNLATTPTVALNVLVETLAVLPPEDSTIISVAGVTVWLPQLNAFQLVTCSVVGLQLVCYVSPVEDTSLGVVWTQNSGVFRVHLPDCVVEVFGERIAFVDVTSDSKPKPFQPASFLGVRVIRVGSSSPLAGLLADLDSAAVDISDYEVLDGCLHGLLTASTAGVFTHHTNGAVPDVLCQ